MKMPHGGIQKIPCGISAARGQSARAENLIVPGGTDFVKRKSEKNTFYFYPKNA